MEIKPIKTENDYFKSLKSVELLWGSKRDTPEGDELDLLVTIIEAYEMKHYPISPPDPIDAIKFRMEQMGMTKTDLAKYLGCLLYTSPSPRDRTRSRMPSSA